MRATETTRSRLCTSAASINVMSRGSVKNSRHPTSTARAPRAGSPPTTSYAVGVGSGPRACRGAKWHALANASMTSAHLRMRGSVVDVVMRDLFGRERALAAHPAAYREIEQRDEEDAERGRVDRALAVRLLLDRELHDEDCVLCRETDDGDESDVEVHVRAESPNHREQDRAQHTERHDEEHRHRHGPALVQRGQQ